MTTKVGRFEKRLSELEDRLRHVGRFSFGATSTNPKRLRSRALFGGPARTCRPLDPLHFMGLPA
jgi:hypothetical protein